MKNLSRYRIIAIGKVRKIWIKDGIKMYLKRMPGLTIKEIRDSNPEKEAKSILLERTNKESLIALTEEGERIDSINFAKRLETMNEQKLVFAIGGEDGLTSEIKQSACWNLSLSPMTIPHELARLLLIEQIYRAHSIQQGGSYHRD